ncbi:MAG: hypothetical protein RCG15_02440 [Candidatus Rickettsia vulgarisii]
MASQASVASPSWTPDNSCQLTSLRSLDLFLGSNAGLKLFSIFETTAKLPSLSCNNDNSGTFTPASSYNLAASTSFWLYHYHTQDFFVQEILLLIYNKIV